MRFRAGAGTWSFAVAVAVMALVSTRASAQEGTPATDVAAGNAERGRALSYTCLGCHGIPNYKNAYPNYRVPKLSGQHPEYIVSSLRAYKSGERSHPTMHAQSASLSEQDMADVAAFFSSEPLKGDGRAEGQVPATVQTCVACHGADGVGIAPIYPTLSGQHADYLARALTDYKRGGRKNAIMQPFASQLTTAQIAEVAEYYAAQQPALATLRRPSRVSAR